MVIMTVLTFFSGLISGIIIGILFGIAIIAWYLREYHNIIIFQDSENKLQVLEIGGGKE